MSELVRTSFEVMGSDGIPGSVVNISGNRSPYTQSVPKKGPAGDSIDGVTGGPRKQTEVNAEVLGPVCAPQTTLFYPNAADHDKTGRNVKLLPPRSGVSDFWQTRG